MKNMTLRNCVVVAGLGLAGAVFADPAKPDDQKPVAQNGPMVQVHKTDKAPQDAHDGRVALRGGVKISMPGSIGGDASPLQPDGTIDVPLNTLGFGPTLQAERETSLADRDYRRSLAFLAKRQSEQPINSDAFGNPLGASSVIYYSPWGGGYGWHSGPLGNGPLSTPAFGAYNWPQGAPLLQSPEGARNVRPAPAGAQGEAPRSHSQTPAAASEQHQAQAKASAKPVATAQKK